MTALATAANTHDLALSPGEGMSRQKMPWLHRMEEHPSYPILMRIPETLVALIPLPRFTLQQLLTLEKGRVIESEFQTSDLIPMKIGAVQIAWGEFEMVEETLALRITKLA